MSNICEKFKRLTVYGVEKLTEESNVMVNQIVRKMGGSDSNNKCVKLSRKFGVSCCIYNPNILSKNYDLKGVFGGMKKILKLAKSV